MDQSQEDKAKQQLQMSGYTQQVLSNPAYKQAMMLMRASLFDLFTRLASSDVEGLKSLKIKLDEVERFQSMLEKTMETGRLAEHQLTKWDKVKSKFNRNK